MEAYHEQFLLSLWRCPPLPIYFDHAPKIQESASLISSRDEVRVFPGLPGTSGLIVHARSSGNTQVNSPNLTLLHADCIQMDQKNNSPKPVVVNHSDSSQRGPPWPPLADVAVESHQSSVRKPSHDCSAVILTRGFWLVRNLSSRRIAGAAVCPPHSRQVPRAAATISLRCGAPSAAISMVSTKCAQLPR